LTESADAANGERVLILGANGQVGIELKRTFAAYGHVVALGRERCDLAKFDQIRAAVAEAQPTIILNAAAYTAVDRAETERELAMRVNGEASGVLAEEARRVSALLVHYSTDYVFDGSKTSPWVEDDPTGPLSVYGASKLDGERKIEEAGGKYLIFRTSWVFSLHGHNFLRTMLRLGAEREQLKIVNDQTGAPTSALAIAQATRQAVEQVLSKTGDVAGDSGLYHMTCAGETTWQGFAEAIFQKAKHPQAKQWPSVTGIPSVEYPTPAARPKNSVMSNEKLQNRLGVKLCAWETALEATLQALDHGATY
jgi:dTDP-4-dehydrorhamnose reductase